MHVTHIHKHTHCVIPIDALRTCIVHLANIHEQVFHILNVCNTMFSLLIFYFQILARFVYAIITWWEFQRQPPPITVKIIYFLRFKIFCFVFWILAHVVKQPVVRSNRLNKSPVTTINNLFLCLIGNFIWMKCTRVREQSVMSSLMH